MQKSLDCNTKVLLRKYTSVNTGCVATGFVSPTRFVTPTGFVSPTHFVTPTGFVSPIRFVTQTRFATRLVCCDTFCLSSDKTCGDAYTICHSRERDTRPFNKELNVCTQLWQSDYHCDKDRCVFNIVLQEVNLHTLGPLAILVLFIKEKEKRMTQITIGI